jgi:ADP-heptose:LPS heptosyltransferase
MNLRVMHAVDYWVGIPLCAAVSAFEKVRSLFASTSPAPPKRLLFIELSEMGSAVLAYPAIRDAVDRLGAENVWFMIFERNREGVSVLDILPDDHIVTVSDRSLAEFTRTVLQALGRCRKAGIDTAVDLELFSRCTALLTYLCGARIRSGFSAHTNEGLYRGSFLTHPLLYTPHHHMTETYLALTRATFAAAPGDEPLLKERIDVDRVALPAFQATAETARKMDGVLAGLAARRRIVFFNPDPGILPLRGWPIEHFARLGQLVVDAWPDVAVAVVGLERTRPIADRILAGLPPDRALNLAGRTATLLELLELFKRGTALVTIDSGPAHFAGLTDIARIVLFGPETPLLYRPAGANVDVCYADLACSPCFSAANHRTSTCTDNQCLKQIAPEQVLERLRGVLSAPAVR